MKKRFLLLVWCVVFGSNGFSQIISGDWGYNLNDSNEATITSYNGAGGAVTIPATLDGYPVKTVSSGESPIFGWANSTVTGVIIPDGVTSIGGAAFQNCTRLTSVVIPDSVTSIGGAAFSGCTSLTSVIIPDGVASIGDAAFESCTGLTSLSIPKSVTSIGDAAFQSCTGLASVTIGNGMILAVGRGAFANCPLVGTIDLPLLATVPSSAFPVGVTLKRDAASLVTAVADEILAALPRNYGIATKEDLGIVLSNTIAQVQAAPNEYNLFSTAQYEGNRASGQTDVVSRPNTFGLFDSTQYEANRITGVAEGKAEVTSNPTAYSLFTESSIMDMNLGGLMLKKGADAGELDLELTIETKDNLATDGWQISERIVRKVSMAGVQRQFLRVRADAPYVAPDVEVLAHPTLGNILTDGAGRVLYFITSDSPGGNPTYKGSAWPYVTVPAAPKADAGVSAMLASSTFGKPDGTYLTINGRPAYYYVGDSEAGQANGQGAGWVWYTIKADGSINQ